MDRKRLKRVIDNLSSNSPPFIALSLAAFVGVAGVLGSGIVWAIAQAFVLVRDMPDAYRPWVLVVLFLAPGAVWLTVVYSAYRRQKVRDTVDILEGK